LSQKPDSELVNSMQKRVLETVEGRLVDVERKFVEKQTVAKFESAHESLCEQIVAMEGMISCKVDRSLLPILQGSAGKMLDFTKEQKQLAAQIEVISNRVSETEGKIATLANEKEDKITMVKRMQTLDKRLGSKSDRKEMKSLSEEVAKMSQQTRDAMSSNEENMRELKQLTGNVKDEVNELSSSMNLETKASAHTQTKIFAELKLLHSKSNHQLEDISRALKQETRLKILEEQSGSNCKIQSAYISDLRRQMIEVKQSQSRLDQQLQVAMRFVNWFTDVKLADM